MGGTPWVRYRDLQGFLHMHRTTLLLRGDVRAFVGEAKDGQK
jgi:hypothetical protein